VEFGCVTLKNVQNCWPVIKKKKKKFQLINISLVNSLSYEISPIYGCHNQSGVQKRESDKRKKGMGNMSAVALAVSSLCHVAKA